jgi:hypothetical protein
MTVQELIGELQKIENKELDVVIPYSIGHRTDYVYVYHIETVESGSEDVVELQSDYQIK